MRELKQEVGLKGDVVCDVVKLWSAQPREYVKARVCTNAISKALSCGSGDDLRPVVSL